MILKGRDNPHPSPVSRITAGLPLVEMSESLQNDVQRSALKHQLHGEGGKASPKPVPNHEIHDISQTFTSVCVAQLCKPSYHLEFMTINIFLPLAYFIFIILFS